MIVRFLKKVFIGFEKGETYDFSEIATISLRRGAGVGFISFFVFCGFFSILDSFCGAVLLTMTFFVYGFAAMD